MVFVLYCALYYFRFYVIVIVENFIYFINIKIQEYMRIDQQWGRGRLCKPVRYSPRHVKFLFSISFSSAYILMNHVEI